MSAIAALTAGIVDYAGLFPPAGLPMPQSVANYADYLESPHRSMLGRFVVPASRLIELETAVANLASPERSARTWSLSALVPAINPADQSADLTAALKAIDEFNQRQAGSKSRPLRVDCVELKANSAADMPTIASIIPQRLTTFVEMDAGGRAEDMIAAVRPHAHLSAKIRTGSLVADQIPTIEQVAGFIHDCRSQSVSLKATAGLHHPLRNRYRLTYEPDSPTAMMHGFLNVFVAIILAWEHSLTEATIAEVLAESTIENFSFGADRLDWCGFGVTCDQIRQLRAKAIISFGSCSFTEPTQELAALVAGSGLTEN